MHCQVNCKSSKILPLMKYNNNMNISFLNNGYRDLITNSQFTYMYGSCINNVIYCYSLDSTETSIYITLLI